MRYFLKEGAVKPTRVEDIPAQVAAEYERAMGKPIGEYVEAETCVNELLQGIMKDNFIKMPMWIRLGYAMNTLSKVDPELIDWEHVNEMLTTNVGKYDFNDFGYVRSVDAIMMARAAAMAGSLFGGDEAWRIDTCKCCGKMFFISAGETRFYEARELELPKRCKSCRMKKNGTAPIEPPKVPEKKPKPVKTSFEKVEPEGAMQAALRKAGLTQ